MKKKDTGEPRSLALAGTLLVVSREGDGPDRCA
jgi:hypothetical protein